MGDGCGSILAKVIGVVSGLIAIFVFIFGLNNIGEIKEWFGKNINHEEAPLYQADGLVWSIAIDDSHRFETRYLVNEDVEDFIAEVVVEFNDNIDEYHGLFFRANTDKNFYSFRVRPNGEYAFHYWEPGDEGATPNLLLGPAIATSMNTGSGARNTLRVEANGPVFTLYINGQTVGTVTDTALTKGEIGLMGCTCDGNTSASASFYDARISK